MRHPSEERLREVYNAVSEHVESRYGIPIVVTDVKDPFTGDFDGREIQIEFDIDLANAVFILAHLFGHTVQWNLSQEARDIGKRTANNPTDAELAKLKVYEREACCLSLQLFHDAGVRDLDQWLSDFAACDFAYLESFYRERKKTPFLSFWKDNQPLLEPLKIPEFTPQKWVSRWDGVVV